MSDPLEVVASELLVFVVLVAMATVVFANVAVVKVVNESWPLDVVGATGGMDVKL